ncbi:11951_t:CDS:2, partial [Ambispora leptoticha]
ISPFVFITDNDAALIGALRRIFPKVEHILCSWHGFINLRDYKELNFAISDYRKLATSSLNTEKVVKYFERMLRVKEKWVGVYTSKLMHFGAITTQHVEGAHSAMKHAIESSGSLTKAFISLDRWLRLHHEETSLQYEKESIGIDPLLMQDNKDHLRPLLGRVSQFALNKIKCELFNATTYEACLCELCVNYNLPCRHLLPIKGPILLSIIPKRWLLFPEQGQLDSNNIIQNELLDNSDNEQQKSSLLEKLDDILAIPEVKLSDIKVPERIIGKGRPSRTKRLPTALEYQEQKLRLNYRIPAKDLDQVYNPLSDGNCGFRALAIAIRGNEENWDLIKLVMNGQLNKRMEVYRDWLGYDIDLLKQILESRDSPCQSSLWFLSPDCAQLAANTFSVPIAIFEERDEQSMLFFLLETPPIRRRNPIILHFINGNHIVHSRRPLVKPFYLKLEIW